MPDPQRKALIVRPEDRDARPTAAGGDVYATLATGEETDGGYFLTHSIVPAEAGHPRTSIRARRRRSI